MTFSHARSNLARVLHPKGRVLEAPCREAPPRDHPGKESQAFSTGHPTGVGTARCLHAKAARTDRASPEWVRSGRTCEAPRTMSGWSTSDAHWVPDGSVLTHDDAPGVSGNRGHRRTCGLGSGVSQSGEPVASNAAAVPPFGSGSHARHVIAQAAHPGGFARRCEEKPSEPSRSGRVRAGGTPRSVYGPLHPRGALSAPPSHAGTGTPG